jgi:hypothetical protein
MRKIGLERCPWCNSTDVYASRPRSLTEVVGTLFLLRPVRCHRCLFRHFRPFFAHTVQYPQETMVSKNTSPGGHNEAG